MIKKLTKNKIYRIMKQMIKLKKSEIKFQDQIKKLINLKIKMQFKKMKNNNKNSTPTLYNNNKFKLHNIRIYKKNKKLLIYNPKSNPNLNKNNNNKIKINNNKFNNKKIKKKMIQVHHLNNKFKYNRKMK